MGDTPAFADRLGEGWGTRSHRRAELSDLAMPRAGLPPEDKKAMRGTPAPSSTSDI